MSAKKILLAELIRQVGSSKPSSVADALSKIEEMGGLLSCCIEYDGATSLVVVRLRYGDEEMESKYPIKKLEEVESVRLLLYKFMIRFEYPEVAPVVVVDDKINGSQRLVLEDMAKQLEDSSKVLDKIRQVYKIDELSMLPMAKYDEVYRELQRLILLARSVK